MQKIEIRPAVVDDANDLLAIYTPYVLETPITFEITVPTEADFRNRILTTMQRYPYLVAVMNSKIVGYAYASAFKGRAAYDWSVETSIYVDQTCRRCKIGHLLYTELERILSMQNIRNVCACITYPNLESISFHERFGYTTVAHFHKSGYKFSSWHDMIWMEKFIHKHTDTPEPFIPYTSLGSVY